MARHQHFYFESHIVKKFQWDKFYKIPVSNLIPVIINVQTPTDEEILKKWEKHFQQKLAVAGLPVPYVITKNPITGVKMLWKESI